jgi:hypothetical protein
MQWFFLVALYSLTLKNKENIDIKLGRAVDRAWEIGLAPHMDCHW